MDERQLAALLVGGRRAGVGAVTDGPEEYVDQVLPPAVGQGGHRSLGDVLQPTTEQGIAASREIMDWRRVVQLAVEPGFDVCWSEETTSVRWSPMRRADMAGEDLVGDLSGIRTISGHRPRTGDGGNQHRRNRQPARVCQAADSRGRGRLASRTANGRPGA